jgi:glycosyltransferase involved in cell wall biosynthesis
MQTDVSVIIPCYNEVWRNNPVEQNVEKVIKVLRENKYSFEVILYNDGSTDATDEMIKKISEKRNNVVWVSHKKNQGRGKTVLDGIKKARGEVVGYIDIDLAVSEKYIPKFVEKIKSGYDIANSNRTTYINISNFSRSLLNRAYKRFAQIMLKNKIKDYQGGYKFFNRKRILPVLKRIKENHWFFDTEILVTPYFLGYKIVDIDVLFLDKKGVSSTVKPLKDTIYFFKNLFSYRKRLKEMFPEKF